MLANGLACLQCTTPYLKGRLFVRSKTFVYDDNDIMTTPVLLRDSSRKENKAPAESWAYRYPAVVQTFVHFMALLKTYEALCHSEFLVFNWLVSFLCLCVFLIVLLPFNSERRVLHQIGRRAVIRSLENIR